MKVSAPGRICLFGEHQDYLNLPVITAAINLRVVISGQPRRDRRVHLSLPDIDSHEAFDLPQNEKDIPYDKERDYFKSVYNVVRRTGVKMGHGFECTVRGNIPINSGTSSSSALNVAWAKFLIEGSNSATNNDKDSRHVASLAHLAEVVEFGEPGGMMDHYATAVGGVLYLDFVKPIDITNLKPSLRSFVLGDSLEPKDTKEILSRVKYGVLAAKDIIKKHNATFDLKSAERVSLQRYKNLISEAQFEVLTGAVLNRDITQIAFQNFKAQNFDHREFGRLLTEHHQVSDRLLKISTPKINRMLEQAIAVGAYGGKINGSGGGGCMFVYAPENGAQIAKAIETVGARAYIVNVDEGVKVHEE